MPCAEELMLCDSVDVKFSSQAEGITGDNLNRGVGIDGKGAGGIMKWSVS